jgi:hypothetical protein
VLKIPPLLSLPVCVGGPADATVKPKPAIAKASKPEKIQIFLICCTPLRGKSPRKTMVN